MVRSCTTTPLLETKFAASMPRVALLTSLPADGQGLAEDAAGADDPVDHGDAASGGSTILYEMMMVWLWAVGVA